MELIEYTNLVRVIREELKLTRGNHPIAKNVYENPETVHIILGDGAEKSQCIGLGSALNYIENLIYPLKKMRITSLGD